jgi:hypothetical protein
MIYACLSTNVVTLGIFEFSYQSFFPKGQLLTAVLISAVWVSFLVVAWSRRRSQPVQRVRPVRRTRTWQRHRFVMAVTGWWFILWLWAPIFDNVLSAEFFQPLLATLGHPGAATWFAGHNGIFLVSVITIVLAGVLVSVGMSGYARIQKYGFYGGLIGFGAVLVLLAVNDHASFVARSTSRPTRSSRRFQRLSEDQCRRQGVRLRLAGVRVQPGQREHAAGADDDVLPALAELGLDSVRRDPGRQRLPARVRWNVRRAVDHRPAVRAVPRADQQDHGPGLLQQHQRGVLGRYLTDPDLAVPGDVRRLDGA